MYHRISLRRALPILSFLLLAHLATAGEPSRTSFRLPSPTPPIADDYRSASADDRVGTYPDPQMHMVWLAPAIGVDARVKGGTNVAFGAELIGATPFQVWRGAFDPAFFPTLRASWRGTGTLDAALGLGFGLFEDEDSYNDGWKTLSYTPQVAWRLIGTGAVMRGFRQDLVFKPGLVHLGLAHALWRSDGDTIHELRFMIGSSFAESW